jgi:hypothetical protein
VSLSLSGFAQSISASIVRIQRGFGGLDRIRRDIDSFFITSGGQHSMTPTSPNQPVERMRGSAVSSLLQSNVLGALPLIAHLLR